MNRGQRVNMAKKSKRHTRGFILKKAPKHDTDAGASGEEWTKVAKKLAKNNTVYTIDLLGCGRSDKPSIQYTSYLYVYELTS